MSKLLLTVLLLSSCAGHYARSGALMYTMQYTWTEVSRGVAQPEAMTAALESGDVGAVAAIDWPTMRTEAESWVNWRVSAGEIGPGVGESLMLQISLFNDAWVKLNE